MNENNKYIQALKDIREFCEKAVELDADRQDLVLHSILEIVDEVLE